MSTKKALLPTPATSPERGTQTLISASRSDPLARAIDVPPPIPAAATIAPAINFPMVFMVAPVGGSSWLRYCDNRYAGQRRSVLDSSLCWQTCQVSDLRMPIVPSGSEMPIATACDSESALDSVTITGGGVTPVNVTASTRLPSARSNHTLYCCPGMNPRARRWISVPQVLFSNVATPSTVSFVNDTRETAAGRAFDIVMVRTKMPTRTAAEAVAIAHVSRRRRPRLAAMRAVMRL